MSLRDQLLKAGLASKKDVRRTNQELKEERRTEQASRKRKAALRAEEAAARALAEDELKHKAEERRAREEAREADERVHRVRQMLQANRMGAKGRVPFHVRSLDGRRVHRLQVPERVAFGLRCGELAVGAFAEPGAEAEYYIIPSRTATKLASLAPEHLVFHVVDTQGISAPEEGFLTAEWEPSLKPHRLPQG